MLHDSERNPAGDGVYFVRGDITLTADLGVRASPRPASAIVFPAAGTNEADMRSILCVMAIESIAPAVRTVVEANNPAHVEHFRRAKADEMLVTSTLASRLLARSALYPGLSELVTDIVSGGTGSELYRVAIPEDRRPDDRRVLRPAARPITAPPCSPSAATAGSRPTRHRLSAAARRRRGGRGRVARHPGAAAAGAGLTVARTVMTDDERIAASRRSATARWRAPTSYRSPTCGRSTSGTSAR